MTFSTSPREPPGLSIDELCALLTKRDGKPIGRSACYYRIKRLPPECWFRIGARIYLRRAPIMALFGVAEQ